MTIPAGFTHKLLRLGIARVHLAYFWHEDETRYEVHAKDRLGATVLLSPELQEETEAAIAHANLPGDGTYLWDLSTGTLTPFGELRYLEGDAQMGTYEVTFEGDEDAAVAAATVDTPTPEEVVSWVTHPDASVRRAAASNPAIPDAWLTPLHGDLDYTVIAEMVGRVGQDAARAALQQAQDPHTLPRDLTALSRAPWANVRLAVARNPSAPAQVLPELADATPWPFPLAVLNNASCPPDLKAPLLDALSRITDQDTRRDIARNQDAPWTLLERWLDARDPFLRARIAEHPVTPVEVRRHLTEDPDDTVKGAASRQVWRAAQHDPTWPVEEQWRIARGPAAPADLWALGEAPNLDPAVFQYLLAHPERWRTVTQRPEVTEDHLLTLLNKHHVTVWMVDDHPKLTPAVLRRLAAQADEDGLAQLAQWSGLPEDLIQTLAQHPALAVRRMVAACQPLTPDLARTLAQDPSMWVAYNLLSNPTLPPDVARAVLERLGPWAINPYTQDDTPTPLLEVYSEFATGETLLAVVRNSRTPASPLVDELRALGPTAIETMIADPETPEATLARLVVSAHDQALLQHPHFTQAMLANLITQRVKRNSFKYRLGDADQLLPHLLGSPLMTPNLWDLLVRVEYLNDEARAEVAGLPNLPPFITRRLAEDPVQAVVTALQNNPAVTPDVLPGQDER